MKILAIKTGIPVNVTWTDGVEHYEVLALVDYVNKTIEIPNEDDRLVIGDLVEFRDMFFLSLQEKDEFVGLEIEQSSKVAEQFQEIRKTVSHKMNKHLSKKIDEF